MGAGRPEVARSVAGRCFERGLVIERCGRDDSVLKVMPPLTIEDELLSQGCRILEDAVRHALAKDSQTAREVAASGAS